MVKKKYVRWNVVIAFLANVLRSSVKKRNFAFSRKEHKRFESNSFFVCCFFVFLRENLPNKFPPLLGPRVSVFTLRKR